MSDGSPSHDDQAARVAGLHYHYPDGRPALRGVDFSIAAGESVALVGPNGAGKSTLLLHLNGVLPGHARESQATHAHGPADRPHQTHTHAQDGPAIWIDGLPVVSKNLREISRRVGLLFQDPDDQLFATTVLEDVAFGPLNLGLPRSEARRVALDCLARVDLAALADRPPHHLSFGERKRACLAGVLACDPILLALDEPTANLDPRARRRFLALIASLPAAKLIATHDLEMALDLCPRTLVLDAGRIVADGPTRVLLGDAALMDTHGLEVPLSLQARRVD